MREIKTRKHSKGIETLEKTVNTGDRMKRAFLQTKERASQVGENRTDAPNEYASDQLQAGLDEVGHDAGQVTVASGRWVFRKGREAAQNRMIKTKETQEPTQPTTDLPQTVDGQVSRQVDGANRKPKTRDWPVQEYSPEVEPQPAQRPKTVDRHPKQRGKIDTPAEGKAKELPSSQRGRQFAMQRAEQKRVETHRRDIRTRDIASKPMPDNPAPSTPSIAPRFLDTNRHIPTVQNTRIKTAQRTDKGIKSTARSVGRNSAKAAQKTVKSQKTAIKTAEATTEVTVKSGKMAERAAKASMVATQKAAKKAQQAARTTAKAVTNTVKAILAALKSLVVAISAGGSVAMIAIVIICLVGLLVASCFGIFFSGEDAGTGMSMPSAVREINEEYEAKLEEIKTSNTYDILEMSGSRAVWPDVLSVYSVKTTTDPDNAQEVASMDTTKKAILTEIFWAMNEITYRTETTTSTDTEQQLGDDGLMHDVEVEVSTTTLYITVSHKTADEMADQYGFNADQRSQLAELLSDENRSMWSAVLYGIGIGDGDIVIVALSQIGNVGGDPYWSWYGFSSRVEWCACFVSWCANECGYIDAGVIPKFAACSNGVEWFSDRGLWQGNSYEPRIGDIIFFDWDKDNIGQDGVPDHVGIVEKVENGYVYTVEGNSSDSCRERSYAVGHYEIFGYGTPAY